jgi:CHAT domain-containing protein
MGAFYQSLALGEPPAGALRRAKLALRHGMWSNPFHWAAFTLVSRAN